MEPGKLHLQGLAVATFVGIHDWEQRVRQELILDLKIDYDCSQAAKTDALEDALDYERLAREVVSFVSGKRFRLLERIAVEVADMTLAKFQVEAVEVTVAKPHAIAEIQALSISVARRRS